MVELKENGITFSNGFGIKKIDGHIIYFDDKDEFLLNTLTNYESSEKFVTQLIKKNVTKDMIAVNIGANVGYYTLLLARQVGTEGKVYSFEPFSPTVINLKKTIKKNGYNNVEIIPKAVSNNTRIDEITVTPSVMYNIITSAETPYLKKIKINVISLDDFLSDKNLKIDFIMMDAEGSEPYILDGMKQTIEHNPNLEIITEFNEFALTIAGTKGEDFYEKIRGFGFYVYNIDDTIQKVKPITKNELLMRYPYECMTTKITNLYLTKNLHKNFDN